MVGLGLLEALLQTRAISHDEGTVLELFDTLVLNMTADHVTKLELSLFNFVQTRLDITFLVFSTHGIKEITEFNHLMARRDLFRLSKWVLRPAAVKQVLHLLALISVRVLVT